jgi:hypothetical protein
VAVAGPIGLIKGWVIGTEDGPVVETRFIQAYLPPAIGTTHALASQSQHEASEVALFAVRVVNWADDHPDFYVYRFKGGTQPVEVCIRACEEGCDDSSCSKSMESGPVDDPYDDRYIKASWKTDKYVLEGPVERDQWEQLNGHNTLMNRLRDQWKKITDELP